MTKPNTIHVATACDDNYAPHCGAMLDSLLTNNPDSYFNIVLLAQSNDLDEENRQKFRTFESKTNCEIAFVSLPSEWVSNLSVASFSMPCWYRIFLPELLPECDRILYLDADTIITGDISPLWEIALNGNLLAAAENPLYDYQPQWPTQQLGLASMNEYLNSGVLLMDLKSMRQDATSSRLKKYATQHPENRCPDQDALSVVCRGQWLKIDPVWNAQSSYFYYGEKWLDLRQPELCRVRNSPLIVHFIGPNKPWQFVDRHPKKNLYLQHRRQSPWPDIQYADINPASALLRLFNFPTQMRIRNTARKIKRKLLASRSGLSR